MPITVFVEASYGTNSLQDGTLESSNDLGRALESECSTEKTVIGANIDLLRINPDVPNEIKEAFIILFAEYYLKPKRPDSPEVQEKLSLNLKKTSPFGHGCGSFSLVQKDQLKKILTNLLDRGIIRRSKSIFTSRMYMIEDNSTYEMHIDFRELYTRIVPDRYNRPSIEEQLITLGNNKKYFSMIELEDAYYHIGIEDDSTKYTSFLTPHGQYEYTKMPLGFKVGPAQFQRFMEAVMLDSVTTTDLIVTANGVLVATVTAEEHLQILKHVFERFVRNKIMIAFDKCEFLCNEIEYFNYLISREGVRPSNKGLQPILEFPIPKDYVELKNFMQLCKYFRKFIENVEIIAEPLSELLKKNQDFKFGEQQREAFETLKIKLTSAPVLAIFKLGDETELHCDASPRGFGAILLQRKDDQEMHPIFYFSRRTTTIEKKYGSASLELCAIGHAVHRFRKYLHGIKFTIVTDADSVRKILNGGKLELKTDSWIIKELQPLNFVVERRKRDRMIHVDALTRPTDTS